MRKYSHAALVGLLTVAIVTGMNWLTIVHAKEELTFTPLVRPFAFAFEKPAVDYHKLCQAIAVAETGVGGVGCRDGTAIKRNNCVGIMTWKNGVRSPKYFKTHQDSINECAYIWKKSYKHFPDLALARKWTGGDNSAQWLATVRQKYSSL